MTHCPCGSGKDLAKCCGPLIEGGPAPTAEALMRSRYTAFTLGNIDYVDSTHASDMAEPFDRAEGQAMVDEFKWRGLEIVRVKDGGEVTDTIEVPGRRAVACQLGGDDGKTLFCLTYDGTIEDLHQAKAAGALETVRVQHAAAGSP